MKNYHNPTGRTNVWPVDFTRTYTQLETSAKNTKNFPFQTDIAKTGTPHTTRMPYNNNNIRPSEIMHDMTRCKGINKNKIALSNKNLLVFVLFFS